MRLTSFSKSRVWGCCNLDMYILDLGWFDTIIVSKVVG